MSAFDKLGTGDLLPDARESFERCVVGKGWELVLLPGLIVDNLKSIRRTMIQAYRYYIASPDRTRRYISPLTAKERTISPEGQPWFSVSEKVLRAADEYDSHIVFTYIFQLQKIFVANTRNSRPDNYPAGPYLRFGQRYRGWLLKDAAELSRWLDDPDTLSVQTSIL